MTNRRLAMDPAAYWVPIAGTIRYIDGQPTGLWGQDSPITLHLHDEDGRIRPATRAERRIARKFQPDFMRRLDVVRKMFNPVNAGGGQA